MICERCSLVLLQITSTEYLNSGDYFIHISETEVLEIFENEVIENLIFRDKSFFTVFPGVIIMLDQIQGTPRHYNLSDELYARSKAG